MCLENTEDGRRKRGARREGDGGIPGGERERERGIGVTQGCVILSWPRLLMPNEETSEL